MKRTKRVKLLLFAVCAALLSSLTAQAQSSKPNVLVIWGDDIGYWNLSTNNDGMMGYQTPNIDRIADQGAKFTDAYSEQSCTAGRSAFITGQHPIRTGLLKVGLPGAKDRVASRKTQPLLQLLKPHGYVSARRSARTTLATATSFCRLFMAFDEFFGNLYHLNAEEEAEHPDYPKDPEFDARFGSRGVLDCTASDKDDPTEDPRFGKMGKQVCHGHRPAHQETHGNG